MEKLQEIWEKISTGFWFLPSILVLLSIILAVVFLGIDQVFIREVGRDLFSFFGGNAGAARDFLATIAGALITVISIAFTITIVALQQASTQYSPLVLRNFTRDKGDQVVLGTYLGTFVYTLIILQSIRTGVGPIAGFVPALSITFGLFLTLICVGLLIYFISHIATSIQVEIIIKSVHSYLVDEIDNLFPENIGIAVDIDVPGEELFNQLKSDGLVQSIKVKKSGFVHSVNDSLLAKLETERVKSVLVIPKIGDFVSENQVILRVSGYEAGEQTYVDTLRKAIVFNPQRSVDQDPMFAINQLVDIALRALSPGVNDPTTAEYCLFHLRDALCRLAGREFPSNKRTYEDNPVVFIFNRPTWTEFVDGAFSQIRRQAEGMVHVTNILVQQLHKLALCLPPGNRPEPLRVQLKEIRANVEKQPFSKRDIKGLLDQINETEKVLEELKYNQQR